MREFMCAIDKAELLRRAIEQLEEADALVQEALGNTEECYDLHNACEALIDDIQDALETVEANG